MGYEHHLIWLAIVPKGRSEIPSQIMGDFSDKDRSISATFRRNREYQHATTRIALGSNFPDSSEPSSLGGTGVRVESMVFHGKE